MAQTTESTATAGASPATAAGGGGPAPLSANQVREALSGKFVCPFCGSINEVDQGVCPRCTMENSAASRKATKTRIGPWYVLQTRNPAAPGMKFETLLSFIRKGRVKARSIVRGPTTHQLWRFAAHVKGLSREFGVCYSCGGGITQATNICPQCNRLQDAPVNPDALLEASKEATIPAPPPMAVAPTEPTASLPVPAPVEPVVETPKVQEPSLESADADFVVPALSATDSMAGFSLNTDTSSGSVSGFPADPSWARIEPRNGSNGGATYHPGGPRPGPNRPTGPGGRAMPPNSNRRPPREGEGFLSAKELAAAFQLDFSPDSVGGSPAAAARPAYTPPQQPQGIDDADAMFAPPRPRRRVLKAVLLIVVLASACAAAALWLDEDLRHQVLGQWLGPAEATQSADPKVPITGDGTANSAKPAKPAAPKRTAAPSDSSRDAARGTWETQMPPVGSTASAPPPPGVRGASTQPGSRISNGSEVMRLYREGIEAERHADWVTAAAKYNEIMTFPKAEWPSDVETRLKKLNVQQQAR